MLFRSVDNAQQPIVPAGHKKQLQTLLSAWTNYETELLQIINRDLPAFNDLYKAKALPAILLPK